MTHSSRLMLPVLAAGAMLIGSSGAAFGGQPPAGLHQIVFHTTHADQSSGREALAEGITRLVAHAAFNDLSDRPLTRPEILGLLLLVSAPPASGSR